MEQRKRQIAEGIENVIRATIPKSQLPRFDAIAKERKSAFKREIANTLRGMPPHVIKLAISKLKGTGAL